MAKRLYNFYYVVISETIIGTHPTKKQLLKQKIVYKGTNAKIANAKQRQVNLGLSKFDEKRASIYSAVDETDRIVLHKY
jgi:hypothetical protein